MLLSTIEIEENNIMNNEVIVRNPYVSRQVIGPGLHKVREASIIFNFGDYAIVLVSDNSCGASDKMVRKSIFIRDGKHKKDITHSVFSRVKQLHGIKASIIGPKDQGEIVDFDSVEMFHIMGVVKDMAY